MWILSLKHRRGTLKCVWLLGDGTSVITGAEGRAAAAIKAGGGIKEYWYVKSVGGGAAAITGAEGGAAAISGAGGGAAAAKEVKCGTVEYVGTAGDGAAVAAGAGGGAAVTT